MKEPIFKASHIVKQFGPTIALNDVDIEMVLLVKMDLVNLR